MAHKSNEGPVRNNLPSDMDFTPVSRRDDAMAIATLDQRSSAFNSKLQDSLIRATPHAVNAILDKSANAL